MNKITILKDLGMFRCELSETEYSRTLDKPLASCPVPSWVPNTIGTWGGNSVKFG